MMKNGLLFFLSLIPFVGFSQISPSNDTTACSAVTFRASTWTSSGISTDDTYSAVHNLGFTFNFYGNNYNQCIVSGNGYISFNTTNANAYSPWPIGAAIPSAANPLNSIMAPWQDLYPSTANLIRISRAGTAPNRMFIVEYCAVPMYSCSNISFTGQIILFEGSNRIETHITNKTICSSWNGGAAIHGIQNSTGTIAHFVPGRNYPATWTATNDAWEFVPQNSSTYTVAPIVFSPMAIGSNVNWTINGNPAGTSDSLVVTPGTTSDTVIGVITGVASCGITPSTYSDTIIVYPNQMGLTVTAYPTLCTANTGFVVASVTGSTGTVTYNWLNPPSTNDTISSLPVGTYIVEATDSAGCVVTDTAYVTMFTQIDIQLDSSSNLSCYGTTDGQAFTSTTGAAGSVSYAWNTNPVQTTPSSTTLPGGVWTVTVTDTAGCKDSVTVTVAQPPQINMVINPVSTSCFGTSDGSAIVYPQGGVGGFSYAWNTVPVQNTQQATNLSSGNWIVTVTDANGCSRTDTTFVNQPAEISPTVAYTEPTCFGGNNGVANITGITGGTPGYVVIWQTSPGQTGNTANNLSAGYLVYDIYDNNSCSVRDSILITQPDSMQLLIAASQSACGHNDGAATVDVLGGSAPFSYAWNTGEINQTINDLAAGTYTVTVMDSLGCTASSSVVVAEFLDVVADFTPSALSGISPFPVTFDNTSTGASSYSWDFGNGQTDLINISPTHSFEEAGKYTVVLYACYTNACCDSSSVVIEVIDEIHIPNVFTPDNDGVNDYFKLNTSTFTTLSIQIFDRWGKIAFESNDVNFSWDGKRRSGSDASAGTYFYVLQITRSNGDNDTYKGNITLLRGN